MRPNVVFKCPSCGSTDVSKDAAVRWDAETQQWDVTAIYDNAHCDGCDSEIKSLDEEEVQ